MSTLRQAPVFSTIVVLTIALGVGVCTALFSVVHGIAFPSMPYRAPERLVIVGATTSRSIAVATEWLTPAQLLTLLVAFVTALSASYRATRLDVNVALRAE